MIRAFVAMVREALFHPGLTSVISLETGKVLERSKTMNVEREWLELTSALDNEVTILVDPDAVISLHGTKNVDRCHVYLNGASHYVAHSMEGVRTMIDDVRRKRWDPVGVVGTDQAPFRQSDAEG